MSEQSVENTSTTIFAIRNFLKQVDREFPIPLSEKLDLDEYAIKLYKNATLCVECRENEILAMVAGYTDNLTECRAYISLVATLPEMRGKGLATKLVKQFIDISKLKNAKLVHLYAVPSNVSAVHMYHKIGFTEWQLVDEPRKNDIHFVYYL